MSRYHQLMKPRQTTVRLPQELADEAEAIAPVQGVSVNSLIVEALSAEIERVRADVDFTPPAKRLLERDKELLDRLARATRYITLAEYVWLAEQVTGLPAPVLSKAGRLDLADSVLHVPAAGFGDDEFYPGL